MSARKTEFATNAGASVYIWLSNESDAPQHYGVCCELTFLQKIQVFNSSGLTLERAAHKRLRDEGKSDNDLVVACSCSTVLTVEPGSRQVVDQGTINRKDVAYELPPGHYTIRERQQGGTSPDPASRRAKAAGLNIVVDEQ